MFHVKQKLQSIKYCPSRLESKSNLIDDILLSHTFYDFALTIFYHNFLKKSILTNRKFCDIVKKVIQQTNKNKEKENKKWQVK